MELTEKIIDTTNYVNRRLIEYIELTFAKCESIKEKLIYSINDIGLLFRPFLFRIGCEINELDYKELITNAFAIELMQKSTLIIDDIIDDSPLRNNLLSMPEKYGVKDTILTGELLKSLSSELVLQNEKISDKKKINILSELENAYNKICTGQLLDLEYEKKDNIRIDEYIELIAYTTGYFISASLIIGAILSDVKTKDLSILRNYGLKLGITYQLRDDIINLISDESNGKIFAEDIRSHKKRLPIIHFLNNSNKQEFEEFYLLWNKEKINHDDAKKIVNSLIENNSIQYSIDFLNNLGVETISSLNDYNYTNKNELIKIAKLITIL